MTPPREGGVTISLPLTDEQATAVVVAADRFGAEPWEIGVLILALKLELRWQR